MCYRVPVHDVFGNRRVTRMCQTVNVSCGRFSRLCYVEIYNMSLKNVIPLATEWLNSCNASLAFIRWTEEGSEWAEVNLWQTFRPACLGELPSSYTRTKNFIIYRFIIINHLSLIMEVISHTLHELNSARKRPYSPSFVKRVWYGTSNFTFFSTSIFASFYWAYFRLM